MDVDVAGNLKKVLADLPEGVRLVAISKFHPKEYIEAAYNAGQRVFGESHEQEIKEKVEQLPKDIEWHFIGHLQTNKVKQVVGKVDLIQSVDSERLLRAIDAEAARQGIRQDISLEVNIGNEESKSGFRVEEVLPILEKIGEFSNVCMKGLMAIPPISRFPGENLQYFQKMFQLSVDIREKINDNVPVDCLSMGMSDDYQDAITCGSTMIRVGTAIFGARDYTKLSSN